MLMELADQSAETDTLMNAVYAAACGGVNPAVSKAAEPAAKQCAITRVFFPETHERFAYFAHLFSLHAMAV